MGHADVLSVHLALETLLLVTTVHLLLGRIGHGLHPDGLRHGHARVSANGGRVTASGGVLIVLRIGVRKYTAKSALWIPSRLCEEKERM